MKYRISVVIPALNEEKNIGACLKSVLQQDYPKSDYEVIMVDAKSEDKTREIAKKMGVKVLISKVRNIGSQRQMGANASHGEIMMFIDSDSTAYPGLLRELDNLFKDQKVVAMQGKIMIQGPNLFERLIGIHVYNLALALLAPIGKFATGSNIAIRKSTLDEIGGFDVKKVSAEDIDLLDKARRKGRVAFGSRVVTETSPRRIRKWGYTKTIIFQGTNLVKQLFTGKSSDVYEDIRN